MSAVPHPEPARLLVIREGIASIPGWDWDSTRSMILGIPVHADVNRAIPVIPAGGTITPALYLSFTNGWVLALNPIFADLPALAPPMIAASAYMGETNRVLDPATYHSLGFATDLASLASLIRIVATSAPHAIMPPYPTSSDADTLIAVHIEPHPHHPGEGEVRLKVEDGGVPVWAIIGATTEAGDNLDAVARDYDVPREAVDAAWAYYQRHRAAIDHRLAENALA